MVHLQLFIFEKIIDELNLCFKAPKLILLFYLKDYNLFAKQFFFGMTIGSVIMDLCVSAVIPKVHI